MAVDNDVAVIVVVVAATISIGHGGRIERRARRDGCHGGHAAVAVVCSRGVAVIGMLLFLLLLLHLLLLLSLLLGLGDHDVISRWNPSRSVVGVSSEPASFGRGCTTGTDTAGTARSTAAGTDTAAAARSAAAGTAKRRRSSRNCRRHRRGPTAAARAAHGVKTLRLDPVTTVPAVHRQQRPHHVLFFVFAREAGAASTSSRVLLIRLLMVLLMMRMVTMWIVLSATSFGRIDLFVLFLVIVFLVVVIISLPLQMTDAHTLIQTGIVRILGRVQPAGAAEFEGHAGYARSPFAVAIAGVVAAVAADDVGGVGSVSSSFSWISVPIAPIPIAPTITLMALLGVIAKQGNTALSGMTSESTTFPALLGLLRALASPAVPAADASFALLDLAFIAAAIAAAVAVDAVVSGRKTTPFVPRGDDAGGHHAVQMTHDAAHLPAHADHATLHLVLVSVKSAVGRVFAERRGRHCGGGGAPRSVAAAAVGAVEGRGGGGDGAGVLAFLRLAAGISVVAAVVVVVVFEVVLAMLRKAGCTRADASRRESVVVVVVIVVVAGAPVCLVHESFFVAAAPFSVAHERPKHFGVDGIVANVITRVARVDTAIIIAVIIAVIIAAAVVVVDDDDRVGCHCFGSVVGGTCVGSVGSVAGVLLVVEVVIAVNGGMHPATVAVGADNIGVMVNVAVGAGSAGEIQRQRLSS
mmetsp:Transcript_1574/g.3567  ORF Transcript_1574/g.3567 Transcript_1574/m.3567 type:complete len:694 (+) Transcript_1574:1680-3761(+)